MVYEQYCLYRKLYFACFRSGHNGIFDQNLPTDNTPEKVSSFDT